MKPVSNDPNSLGQEGLHHQADRPAVQNLAAGRLAGGPRTSGHGVVPWPPRVDEPMRRWRYAQRHETHHALSQLLGIQESGELTQAEAVVDFLRLSVARGQDLRQLRVIDHAKDEVLVADGSKQPGHQPPGTDGQTPRYDWVVLPLSTAGKVMFWHLGALHPQADLAQCGLLLDDLAREGAQSGHVVVQTLVDEPKGPLDDLLNDFGLLPLAGIHYLERTVRPQQAVKWPQGYETLSFAPGREAIFRRALELSYEQTLDCPSLASVRELDDILESHKAAGASFDPAHWEVLLQCGQDQLAEIKAGTSTDVNDQHIAGVMLGAPSWRGGVYEVVYLGMSKAHRGKGLARLMMRHMQWQAKALKLETIALAVDSENAPALRLYYHCGLQRTQTRYAYWAELRL